MDEPHENFFADNVFRYVNAPCDVRVNIEDVAVDQPSKKLLKMQARATDHCNFAFTSENGLIRCGPEGALLEADIVGKLIALPSSKDKEIIRFFSQNGFLFPIGDDRLTTIDVDVLWNIVNRVKALVLLMSAMGGKKNYKDILHYTVYLLYSDSVELRINEQVVYQTPSHAFNDYLHNAFNIPEIDRSQQGFSEESYTISDTLYPPYYQYDIQTYLEALEGSYESKEGSLSPAYRALVMLYVNAHAENAPRRTIDFLLHYQEKVGIFKNISIDGIEYYSDPLVENFTSDMKKRLVEIAREVISTEINYNIHGIYPYYDPNTMRPAWIIGNLLQAVYFSLFFNNPEVEIYRKCANPNCRGAKYFRVKTTMQKKKYCCPECANADAQRRYRLKKLRQ